MPNNEKSISKEKKEKKRGRDSGRKAASKNKPGPDYKGVDPNPTYQKTYLQPYDNYGLNKKRKESNQADPALSYGASNAINFLEYVPGREESAPLHLSLIAEDLERNKPEFNSEFFCPQQSTLPSPCFPNSSTRGMECSIGYSEKLNPPQELHTVINTVEELSEYLDSLTSPSPDVHRFNSLLPQDKAMSLNLNALGDLLGVYETSKPMPLNLSRLYQPLFFSTRIPQEPETRQETSIYSMTDRINKKNQI